MAVGQRIREHRRALKLTLARLAEKLEVSVAYVSRVERGHENLTVGTITKFAEALGAEVRVSVEANPE